jgi:hypothetical protein
MSELPANSVEKNGYSIEFNDDFGAPDLDASRWFPYYLPQWSSRKLGAARYSVADGTLRLQIKDDQPQWCPEFDGALRVSCLQTGCFAGTLGSAIGRHRFRPQLVMREVNRQLPTTPLFLATAKRG